MAIHINPERINVPSRTAGRTGDQRRRPLHDDTVVIPKKAHVNFIPSPQSLSTLINSAVVALRKGVFWDRGTILNLIV
jgi:hypothetical protein